METQPLKLHVDSKQAQADLAALAKALDTAGNAVERMKGSFATGMAGVNKSLNASMQSMEKFAQVAALLSKVKLSADPAKHVREFASAMNALSRAKAIDATQITQIKTLSKTLAEIKVPNQAQRLTAFLNAVGAAKAPTASTIGRINDLLKALSRFQGSAAIRNVRSLTNFFNVIASIRVPSAATIARLEKMFTVLGTAKSIPGAQKIAADLDHIAGAAGRAGAALNSMPARVRGVGPAYVNASKGVAGFHQQLGQAPAHAKRATGAYASIGMGLGGLSTRFKLTYQAGTVFNQLFSAFTVGVFLKSVYDTNIALDKLSKALLFSAGSFEGAKEGMSRFVGVAQELGLRIDKTAEAYGRFTLSAKASGYDITQSESIFRSVAATLQIVGASSEQTELAFYGLTQMLQKGKVVSEEFNRQIGEQIPGNAVIGARALSQLEGRAVSVAEFFKRMSLGEISSAKFVPAYAKALDEEFGDLLKVAQRRPDVALNRLINAFILFKRTIGESGFMSALGREFNRLTDRFIVGEGSAARLTPTAQKLAETLGKNLANMVRLLGRTLEFLVENLDGVVASLKGLIALKVGATFVDWGSKAVAFAGTLIPVKNAATAAGTAAVASGAAGAAGAAGSAAGGGLFGMMGRRKPPSGAITAALPSASKDFRAGSVASLAGFAATTAPINTRPGPNAFAPSKRSNALLDGGFGAGALAAGAISGFGGEKKKRGVGAMLAEFFALKPAAKEAADGVLKFEAAANKSAGGGVKSFLGAIMKMGPLLLTGVGAGIGAAAIALAMFGDRTTTVSGKAMTFNDIVGGGFKVLGDKIGAWWNTSGKNLGAFGFKLGDLGSNAGEIVASIVAAFVTLGEVIGNVIGGIVKGIDALIFGPFRKMTSVLEKMQSGNFLGAAKEIAGYLLTGGNVGDAVRQVVGGAGRGVAALGNYSENREAIVNAGAAAAAGRTNEAAVDAATQRENAEIEASLQARAQALKDQAAAAELEALRNRAALGDLTSPTWESVLKKFAEAGEKTAEAATVAAGAAATTADAAKTAAGGVASGAPMRPAANQNVQAALANAARVTGVSEDVLTAIAYRESKFNVNAKNPTSSASGLFQFTYDTARQYGLTRAKSVAEYENDPGLAMDAQASSLAAGRLATANAAAIKKAMGRDATGGELYGAHFLGSGGMIKMLQAMQKNPNASAAALFPQAAKSNANIFFNDPKTMQSSKTLQQVYDNLVATVGGSAGKTAAVNPNAALEGITEVEGESLTAKWVNLNKQLAAITSGADPAAAAVGQMQETLDTLTKLARANDKLVEAGAANQFTPELQQALARLRQKLEQDVADALNPFNKDVRLGTSANDVTAMRVRGLSDEADFQARLNDLREQGYDITKLDTQANRDAMRALRERTNALQAELEVVESLNAARVAGIQRTGTARDILFAQSVKPADGQTFDQAVAAMSPAERAARERNAAIQAQAQTADAAYTLSGSIMESATAARLSPSAQALRADYKSFLEELSGVADASLSRLEAKTDPALQQLARRAAEIKQAIENPPGFQRWADSLEPFAKRLEDIKAGFAEGISQGITDALYGEDVDWNTMLRDTAKQITKAHVDSALGGIIGMATGRGALTPEQQATVAAADALTQASAQAAQAQTSAADVAATSLNTSATNLNSAAQALTSAATAISTGGAASAGAAGVDAVANAVTQGSASVAQAVAGAGAMGGSGSGLGAPIPTGAPIPGFFREDPTTGGFIGQAPGNMLQGLFQAPDPISAIGTDIIPQTPFDTTGLKTMAEMMGGAQITPAGAAGGLGGMLQGLGSTAFSLLGFLGPLIGKKKQKKVWEPKDINGVIGEHRAVNVTGTQVGPKSNMIGDLLSIGLNMFTGGFGAGGGWSLGKTFGNMGSSMSKNLGGLGRLFGGAFLEGGMSNAPAQRVPLPSSIDWSKVPHFAEGTPNTSGGMPAMLHPNEAVIPLSRGRKIPVELGADQLAGGQPSHVFNNNFTIMTPNADSFRQAQGSIQRKTNRDMKRAAVRNLSPH